MECTCKGREGVELNKFRHIITKEDGSRERAMLCENCYKAVTGENGHRFADKHSETNDKSGDFHRMVSGYDDTEVDKVQSKCIVCGNCFVREFWDRRVRCFDCKAEAK